MSDAVFFSPRAIKANEDAVRQSFASRPGDGADDQCRSRMGQRLGPAYIRAVIDEVNRGTPLEVYAPTLLSMLGWMLANTVAAESDLNKRAATLGRYLGVVQIEAYGFAIGNDIVEPGDDALGEKVGGHA